MEIVAVALGIGSVVAAVYKSVLTWILGLLSAAVLTGVFYESGDFGLMYLQINFVGISILGFLEWDVKKINHVIWYLPIIALSLYSSNAVMDFLALFFGIVGTYYLVEKAQKSWLFFIVSNLLSIVVCYKSELYLMVGQYIIFIIISIKGYLQWTQD